MSKKSRQENTTFAHGQQEDKRIEGSSDIEVNTPQILHQPRDLNSAALLSAVSFPSQSNTRWF